MYYFLLQYVTELVPLNSKDHIIMYFVHAHMRIVKTVISNTHTHTHTHITAATAAAVGGP